jgi:acetyl-CoA carboxylase biotin carboxylase subunit
MPRIRKILVANRGEIALRIMRTCREMGIQTVAVYSDADRAMPYVSFADESHHIGASPSRESYLAMEKVLSIARRAHVDAIHPGYGFLSENAAFARQTEAEGFMFIGPTPSSIDAMGDKTEARRIVSANGVPVVPGTPGPVSTVTDADAFCKEHGFPVLLKAAAGGGGKGMRIVHEKKDLGPAFSSAQSEARSAFGDARVYVEKYLTKPRHIEFQILADSYGTTVHLGERECSIQRRHQKIIEEAPSILLDDALRARMGQTAIDAARACGYRNAGTIEFLVDGHKNFYFLEMNTRLQVEHAVTEMITGLDLVALQIRIAMGERLPFGQTDVRFRGHAIECRISAEDITNNFLPSTGTITHLRPASGHGVRDDRGVEEGGEVSVYYDPMIAKLIVSAGTRGEAIERMKRALQEYEILGVKTNIPVCLFTMNHPQFISGDFDTHFIPAYFSPDLIPGPAEEEKSAAAVLCARLTHREVHASSLLLHGLHENGKSAAPAVEPDQSNGEGSAWKRQRRDFMRSS